MTRRQEHDVYSCAACSLFVSFGDQISFKNKLYHTDCFTCSVCSDRLNLTERIGSRRGHLYCPSCTPKRFTPFLAIKSNFSLSRSSGRPSSRLSKRMHKESRDFFNTSHQSLLVFDSFDTISQIDHHGFSSQDIDMKQLSQKIEQVRTEYPFNLMTQAVTEDILRKLSEEDYDTKLKFYQCITPGLLTSYWQNGILAMRVTDYENFKDLFHRWIKIWNNMHPQATLKANVEALRYGYKKELHKTYNLVDQVEPADIKGVQMQFIRNLKAYPLMGNMDLDGRGKLEEHLLPVFGELVKTSFKGKVIQVQGEASDSCIFDLSYSRYDFTEFCPLSHYYALRNRLNPFLKENKVYKLGVNLHGTRIEHLFPQSSGIYISEDQKLRIFYNHQDQLLFQYHDVKSGRNLQKAYSKVVNFMKTFEECYETVHGSIVEFHISDEIGYVNSSPSDIGSGFTSSAFLEIPEILLQDGLKHIAKSIHFEFKRDISKRGKERGLVQISPIPKLLENEEMIIRNLYKIIPKILLEEQYADEI